MASVSVILNDKTFLSKLEEKADEAAFGISLGVTTPLEEEHFLNVVSDDSEDDNTISSEEESDEEPLMDDLFREIQVGSIDADRIMVKATHASRPQGVDAEHLSKIWQISLDDAKRTLDVTRQSQVHTADPTLAKNFGTNDRILRYRHVDENFFMDTLFATSKAGKSTRGNTCCQLFVTDKGFLYIVPLKSKKDVILAMKPFSKEIGVPDAIICLV